MSLINDMLQDLEKRTGHTQQRRGDALYGLYAPTLTQDADEKRNWFFSFVLFTAIVVMSVLAFYLLPRDLLRKHPHAVIAPTVAATSAVPALALPPAVAPVKPLPHRSKPVALLNYQVRQEGLHTYLNFAFQGNIVAEIKHWYSGNTLFLYLPNVKLDKKLMALPQLDMPIESLDASQDNDGFLQISMRLKHGAILHNIGMDNNTQSQLQLDFYYQPKEFWQANHLPSAAALKKSVPEKIESVMSSGAVVKKISRSQQGVQEIDEEYQAALALADQGDQNQAISVLKTMLQKTPQHRLARQLLAALLIEQGRVDAADNVVKIGLQQAPEYAPFAELAAHILVDKGEDAKALSVLQAAEPEVRENPDYYAFMAAIQQRLGQPAAAASAYQRILQIEPDNAVWWLGLGISLEASGRAADAMQAYTQAHALGTLNAYLQEFVSQRMATLQG